jgi:hypothetical protein
MTLREQRDWILDAFRDKYQHNGVDGLTAFMRHCGVDIAGADPEADVEATILAHYQLPGGRGYDIERLPRDLATYPPVAERIAYLEEKIRHRRQQKRDSKKRRKAARSARRGDSGATP